jgi:hypothetical protein
MAISASRLRENIYSILDEVLASGIPVEVERKGRILKIVAEPRPSKLARVKPIDLVNGDPEDLVHLDWSAEWSELK